MRHLKWAAVIVAAAFVVLGSNVAQAAPFKFTHTSPLFSTNVPGTTVGDILTLSVIADNGSDSLAAQVWNHTHILLATVTVGSYSASFLPPLNKGDFATNAGGSLTAALFEDLFLNNTDSIGNTTQLFVTGLLVSKSPSASFFLLDTQQQMDLRTWTVSAVPVPEPSLLLLLTSTLLLPLLRARRRRAGRPTL